MRYKVTVRFAGAATVQIDAASPAEAREIALQLSVADLARTSMSDINQLDVKPLEITAATALTEGADDYEQPDGVSKPRPSGWYRS